MRPKLSFRLWLTSGVPVSNALLFTETACLDDVTNAIMRLFLLLVHAEVGAVDMPISLWKVSIRQISFILPQDFYRSMITICHTFYCKVDVEATSLKIDTHQRYWAFALL